ncbi:MAG TPA: AmmeMemoRadiSam system protein A, partial [Bacillota bacterium]|nr:AmmeMemoRadiSam system protein A [Bacillota bacterium]
DHGAAVPLYYLQQAGVSVPGLHLTYTFAPRRDLYRFGQALRRAVEARGLPTAVIASGDLSHRLIPGAPAGYSPRGAEYDRLLMELLREGRVEEFLALDEELVEEAGECAYRSFLIALGMLAGENFQTEIFSYEGPFGVGYLVAELRPASAGEERATAAEEGEKEGPADPVKLARQALRHYLEQGHPLPPPDPLPPFFSRRAGVFVSLKKGGELRGCIGTVEPVRKNLAEEIIMNAVSAGLRDPRFPPVRLEELDEITFSVDVLMPPEKIESAAELDPARYGVIVRSGHRSGLLLPDIEGINTVEEQIAIARRKAGIGPHEPVELYRFEVHRYG